MKDPFAEKVGGKSPEFGGRYTGGGGEGIVEND
jgi:hypothetical protein